LDTNHTNNSIARIQQKTGRKIYKRTRKRAVIYCRVSTDRQEQDGESLEYQEAKCRGYAELHDMDVVIVLLEAKSGFIHYSLREKLSIARQFIRDGLADVIIIFDLRRFSRNFVHSAMIFEEIESNGGEIVSVSENIDNSLTGKLIRSILAWSAESERHKIVEYANRRWQTRVEVGLPLGIGRSPYGWDWKDKGKTAHVINQEQAAVRVSIFHMFVELDMSLRAIMRKLTEDRVLTPTYAWKFRDQPPEGSEIKLEYCLWKYTAVRELLMDPENIGTLVICKSKQRIGPDGKRRTEVHPNRREIPGGIPAIISPSMYERALAKLKTNKADKSHLPLKALDYLLRGHITCATCGCSMKPRTQKKGRQGKRGTSKDYPFYKCTNLRVIVHEGTETHGLSSNALDIGNGGQEWFSAKAAAQALGVNPKTIHYYRRNGTITRYKYEPYLQIHRGEIVKLQQKGFLQRNTEEIVRARVEISYSPRFGFAHLGENGTAVAASFTTRRYM
jgi:site-specific DNA recombinase